MKEIIHIERIRILNLKALLLFFSVIILFSVSSSYTAVKNYNIPDQMGIAVSWNERGSISINEL